MATSHHLIVGDMSAGDITTWAQRVGTDAQTTWITVRRYPDPPEDILVGFPHEPIVEELETEELDGGGLPAEYRTRPVTYVLAWEGKSLSGHWRIFRLDDIHALREA